MRSQRLSRKDEWYKDRSILREGDSASDQSRASKAYIKDYSLKHRVTVEWDISPDAVDDRILLLKVDNYTVVIDHDELLRSIRFA